MSDNGIWSDFRSFSDDTATDNPMTTLTPDQRRAVEQAGDQPVEVTDPQTNTAYYLIKAEVFRRMTEAEEERLDMREKEAWANLGRKARSDWAKENPY
jgi:hypothetical protein